MTIKTLAAAVALTLAPVLAFAEGCNYGQKVTMSCAEGMVYDSETGTCVTNTTS
ncbi:carbohydrate-binding module family 14 protein [Roseobacter sp. EG26]|uniref:carbohydrate-binding module family 14 protein n=1 Tax=Roseobacter sp. EG26 TaxID=3412477 RepID=UPI003CE46597